MRYYARILLLFFLGVMLPCAAVFTGINIATLRQYEGAVMELDSSRLQAIRNLNRMMLGEMNQTTIRLSLDPSVQTVGRTQRLYSLISGYDRIISMLRSRAMIDELVRTNHLLESVYFYADGNEYVFSTREREGVVLLEQLPDTLWFDAYARAQSERRQGVLMPVRSLPDLPIPVRPIISYVSVITPFTGGFHGTLVFNIYEDRLLQMYAAEPEGNIALFDMHQNFITGTNRDGGAALFDGLDWDLILGDASPGNFRRELDGERYQYTYMRSPETGLVLVSADNMSDLAGQLSLSRNILFLFFIFFVPFAAMLIWILSRRLYSPIEQLARQLMQEGGSPSDITAAVQDLLREDRRLFTSDRREELRSAALWKALADEPLGEEEINAIMPYGQNLCILAALDTREESPDRDSRMRLLLRLIEQEFDEEAQMQAVARRYESGMAAIILSIRQSRDDPGAITEKLKNLQSKSRVAAESTVSFAAGSLLGASDNLRRSLEEAKNALEYRFLRGKECVLFYDDTVRCTQPYNGSERIAYISRCFGERQKSEMLKGLGALVSDIGADSRLSFIGVSLALHRLVTLLTEYIEQHQSETPQELLPDQNALYLYRAFWHHITLEEAIGWLGSVFARILDYRQSLETASGNKYIREILSYADENYTRNITVDSIADHLGLSYSHVRKLFKDATGKNLVEYIGALRVENAKKLLADTNYSVKEIAAMCGYNHERTFFRAFTHAEGMPPGEYKRQIKEPKGE